MAHLDLASLLLIAIGLSADCFAVAVSASISAKSLSSRQVLRTASAFGIAQVLMPTLGWLVGRTVVDLIAAYDHWVAFALLTIIGGRMLWDSLLSRGSAVVMPVITRGAPLL